MAKRKKIPSISYKKFHPVSETISSEIEVNSNATLGPDASLENSTTGSWIPGDSTNAPEIGEEESREQYAKSHSELFDKYIMSQFGRKSIPFLIVIAVIGYIFIQDNGAGRLSDWNDISWFILKSGVVLGVVLVILGIQWIYKKISKKE